MFVELMPLLKQRTLLITVARVDERLKVNVIPVRAKEGEDEALTTPLSYTGSPEELDRELGQHLAGYVDSYLALGSTLAEAKAEMDAGPKPRGRGQRPRNRPQNPIQASGKRKAQHQSLLRRTPRRVCFLHKPKLRNLAQRRVRPKGLRHDRRETVISQLHLQRCQTSGSRSTNDARRSEEPLQPPIPRTRHSRDIRTRGVRRPDAVQLREGDRDEGLAATQSKTSDCCHCSLSRITGY